MVTFTIILIHYRNSKGILLQISFKCTKTTFWIITCILPMVVSMATDIEVHLLVLFI